MEIVRKESRQLNRIMTTINTAYVTLTNKRRGLVDGIGTIAKTLFGIMDANDDKLINEQLQLLENRQQTIQHTVKNQIQICNEAYFVTDGPNIRPTKTSKRREIIFLFLLGPDRTAVRAERAGENYLCAGTHGSPSPCYAVRRRRYRRETGHRPV